MARQDREKRLFVPFVLPFLAILLFIVIVLFAVLLPFLIVLVVEAIVIAVGLYYIIKLAVKAALNESRIRIEKEPPENNPGSKSATDS